MKDFKCPHCKEDLKEVGLYEIQEIKKKYPIKFSCKTESFDYNHENDEDLDVIGETSYHCSNCDEELGLNYEEIFNN